MLLSFLTQQKNQHTQSQILSWNTDAFPANFSRKKAQAAYKTNHAFFYENILHHKTFTFSKPNDSVINEQINVPRRSMTGILLLFTENPTAGDRDSEKFVNPYITSVQINIDGVPNMLYSKGMLPTDQWESIKQCFPAKSGIRSYRNKILHRRQVCFVGRSQESRG